MGVAKKWGVAALAAALLTMPACAPAGQTGQGGQSGQTGQAGAKNFSFYLYQKATGLNPYDAGGGADSTVVHLHFQPLLTWVGGKYEGRLAEKWEFAPDGKTFTFTLRDGNKWSDGTPITAPDLKWALESHLDKKTGSYIGGYLQTVKGAKDFRDQKAQEVSGITAPDDKTLKIELDTPNVGFPALLTEAALAPKHVYGSLPRETWKGNPAFREPKVGSGPYLFSKWVSDDQIEFVANPAYTPKPKLAKVYAKYLTGDVAAGQLTTGEIDAAEVPATDVKSMQGSDKTKLVQKPGNKVMALHTPVSKGKLKDKRVRQAIMYAIDRQGIVNSVLAGQGKVANAYLFGPDWAIAPDANPYNRDVEKAKALLKEANWDPNTEVNLDIVPGQADRDAVMRIVVGNLTEAGIRAKITPHSAADIGKGVTSGDFDLLISPLTMAVPEPSLVTTRVTCANVAPAGPNIGQYCNPELDKVLAEGQATSDQTQRTAAYQKAYKILNDDVMNFPLYSASLNWGTGKTVEGFDPAANPITATAATWGK